MLRSLVFLIIGLILTILIFSGIFAGIPRKPQQKLPTENPIIMEENQPNEK